MNYMQLLSIVGQVRETVETPQELHAFIHLHLGSFNLDLSSSHTIHHTMSSTSAQGLLRRAQYIPLLLAAVYALILILMMVPAVQDE